MDESFAYSCPNCGGTVTYSSEDKKWTCDYCHNKFDKLYDVDGKKLDEAKNDIQLFYYYCPSCGNSFYSAKETATCSKCNANITGNLESLAGVINNSVKIEKAKYDIWKALMPYSKKYNIDLNKVEVQSKNVKSDLINGSLIIKNNKTSTKYIFSGVIYPFLDTDNYRIIYDYANEGFNSIDNHSDFNQTFFSIAKEDKERNIDDNYIRNKIIETCKELFIKKYGNSDVVVQDELKIKKGMLMKVYYYSFNYEGKDYTTYYIDSVSSDNGIVSIDVPKDPSVTVKMIRSESIMQKVFDNVALSCLVLAFVLAMASSFRILVVKSNLATLLVVGIVLLGVIFKMLSIGTASKVKQLKASMVIDESLFYKNLVENCKLVKKVRR